MKARLVSSAPIVFTCGAVTRVATTPPPHSTARSSIQRPMWWPIARWRRASCPSRTMHTPREPIRRGDRRRRARASVLAASRRSRLVGSVEAYDATANTWTTGRRRYRRALRPHRRRRTRAANVYVIGGTSNGMTAIGSVEVYATDDQLVDGGARTCPHHGSASAQPPRTTVASSPIGGGLPGAADERGRGVLAEHEDVDHGTEHAHCAPVASSRRPDRMVSSTQSVGAMPNTTPLSVVEVLDPVSGTWTTGPSLSNAPLLVLQRRSLTTVVSSPLAGVGDSDFSTASRRSRLERDGRPHRRSP